MKWPETVVATPSGLKRAIAPLVISASRATDIPAFHAQWFMDRVRAGYCLWQNPFNAGQQRYISFERCAVIVFWSKDPQPLLPFLAEIEARGFRYYFQFTLNDYVREGFEPGLPPLARRIATFQELSRRIGRERVIWRFDPIILGPGIGVATILERLYSLAEKLAPHTEKLVFSFLDMYKNTALRLRRLDPRFRAPDGEEALAIARGLARLNAGLSRPLRLGACAEYLDLRDLGVEKNSCIDADLLRRLCPENTEIQRTYAEEYPQRQGSLLTLRKGTGRRAPRDKGQRPACGCAPAKDIGRYNTCPHLCAYCYANSSEAQVRREAARTDSGRERL